MKTNVVILGDCLDVLREMPDNSIDSVVTDPPYGLSKEPNIREVLEKWLAGEDYEHRGGGFMGKSWDSFVPGPSVWREVYRVLKPGAHALVFAGTRTQDLMTISLRLAGFEIRDVIEWLYFSGFPKSLDIAKEFDKRNGIWRGRAGKVISENGSMSAPNYERTPKGEPITDIAKKWDGWGTALKPAHEPIIVARKPLIGTVAENVERWGTGAINVDGCRIEMSPEDFEAYVRKEKSFHKARQGKNVYGGNSLFDSKTKHANRIETKGRFPANIVTTEQDAFWSKYCNVTPTEHQPIIMARKPLIDADTGRKLAVVDCVEKYGTGAINIDATRIGDEDLSHEWDREWKYDPTSFGYGKRASRGKTSVGRFPANCVTTEPDAFFSKYFNVTPPELCKKASKRDRNSDWRGEEITLPERVAGGLKGRADGSLGKQTFSRNTHPTVKPTDLMAWLVRLVTPPGGVVLDPFAGSGSTLVAAKREGFRYIGIEREAEYVEIAKARVG